MASGHYFQALERKLGGVRSRPSALSLVCVNLIPLVGGRLGEEYLVAPINEVIEQPYRRIFLMHAVIMATGFLLVKSGTSTVGLPVLVLFKLVFDLVGHISERERWVTSE